ncbi:Cof-type HAD-IIB family hydrolase [Paenibacillus sp. SYP-B3998]|uniref:Cof-type HAD-IIB family hydrolase n=1 Tax=Paenibacillus sp. SYP-B3998 TaxID=2678564 RepID=A0A6G4A1L2_9BACL|nr:Cof-type HAD-IIB family hydrolase [Paenibacillus sp. SYP-B3998]NEW07711.1 Cof-type HAD-IIB family hydrolase [Paenibacillus sp. SYP-B3998]
MAYKIVFFDIDGTLVNEEKEIPASTLASIQQLKTSGIEPVIATGRAPYFIKSLAEELGIDSYVCLNGGYAVYRGEPLYKRIIAKESVQALVELAAKHKHSLVFEGEHTYVTDTLDHPFVLGAVGSLKVELPRHDPHFWQTNDVYQIFLHCESGDEHLYEGMLTELKLIRWHQHAMDVLPAGGSKAQGIAALLEMINVNPEEAVAFGDGLNDIEMLEYVGLGIAMGNSHKDLLPYADYVTTHVDEDGIRNGLIEARLISV